MVISVSRSSQYRNTWRNSLVVILDLATNPDIGLNSDAIPKEEFLVSRKSFYFTDGEWMGQSEVKDGAFRYGARMTFMDMEQGIMLWPLSIMMTSYEDSEASAEPSSPQSRHYKRAQYALEKLSLQHTPQALSSNILPQLFTTTLTIHHVSIRSSSCQPSGTWRCETNRIANRQR